MLKSAEDRETDGQIYQKKTNKQTKEICNHNWKQMRSNTYSDDTDKKACSYHLHSCYYITFTSLLLSQIVKKHTQKTDYAIKK